MTGCVPAADASAPTSEPPSPTPSVEPTPSIAAKPALALGGDCAVLSDEAGISRLIGEDVTLVTDLDQRATFSLAVLGGSGCTWIGASQGQVSLALIPAVGLEAQVAEAEAQSPFCYGAVPEDRCSFSTVVAGYWLSGIVGVTPGADGTALDAIDILTARLADVAATAAPVAAARPDGVWPALPDCSGLGAGVDSAAVLGAPYVAAAGNRGELTPGASGAIAVVGDLTCEWGSADASQWFTSELMPGAGWAITELAARAGAEPVVVDGALQAVALPVDGGLAALYATDGVNLAWVTVPTDIDRASSSALVSALMAAASR
ncbi:MAG: hypothetical protein HOQ00_11600 [Agromyces sp.]|nr:hypothetical protein [Agromyces sp.]